MILCITPAIARSRSPIDYLGYGARKRSAATRVAQKVTHSASGVTQKTVIDDDSK
jgi:hypothetical protein